MVQDTGDGSGHFLYSKEGVTQGDSLAMITYGIGVLSLIREFWSAQPRVTQPWNADDVGAGGTFQKIMEHFRYLQARGPARGYYLEPTKSILVVAPGNVSWEEEHFWGLGIQVVTGHRYLGGYIGDGKAKISWLKAKIKGWTESVTILSGFAQITCSLLTQDYKSPSNRSGLSCRG